MIRGDSGRKKASEPRSSLPSRPLWMWILLFLLPLIASELMFYVAGRGLTMILFAVVWVAFWAAIMHRSGWAIFKRERPSERPRRKG